MTKKDSTSPNPKIDKAIEAAMERLEPKKKKDSTEEPEPVPLDVAVKVNNTAIAWEKVKHGISDKSTPLDPDLV